MEDIGMKETEYSKKIEEIILSWLSSGNENATYPAQLIIKDVLIPIAKEAFEAGEQNALGLTRDMIYPNEWIEQKFK